MNNSPDGKTPRARKPAQFDYQVLEPKQLLAGLSPLDSVQPVDRLTDSAPIQVLTTQKTAFVDTQNSLPQQFSTTIVHDGQTYKLNFTKAVARGENFRLLLDYGNGHIVEADAGPDRAYYGEVEGRPDYQMGAALTDRGLIATIKRPGMSTIVIEPHDSRATSFGGSAFSIQGLAGGFSHDVYDVAGDDSQHVEEPSLRTSFAATPTALTGLAQVPGTIGPVSVETEASVPPPSAANSDSGLGSTYSITVRQAELGIEITNNAWTNRYSSSTASVTENLDALIAELDSSWLGPALTKHVLGTVIVRMTSAADPYTPGTTSNSLLDAFRNRWNSNPGNENGGTHDLAMMHHGGGGGGLAWVGTVGESYRYGIAGANTRNGWRGYIHHEIGHNWGLGHSHGRQELNTSGNQFGIMWSGPHDRATSDEAQRILQERNEGNSGTADIGPIAATTKITPFGRRDDHNAIAGVAITIDVIGNDYDANNDVLNVQVRDTVSNLGGTITLSAGTGPGGRDQLIYTAAANSSGKDYFHYNVIDGTGKTGWGYVEIDITNPTVTVDLNQTEYQYDFGTPYSPVFTASGNYVGITNLTNGDITWDGNVYAIDRGPNAGANDINRDMVSYNGTRTLEHKIKNGVWSVLLNMGDAEIARDDMVVKAEGVTIAADVDSAAGVFTYVTAAEITVLDGSFSLELSDAGGADGHWALNRMILTWVGESPHVSVDLSQTEYDYDFGPSDSPVQSGWTQIQPDTFGDISWSGPVIGIDRGTGNGANNINRDFVYSSQPTTLSHQLADGLWRVSLNMGDTLAHDNMQVKAEGIIQHADVDNAPNTYPYANFDVVVTDGELNIEFSDQGGTDPNWVLTRMSLDYLGEAPTVVDLTQTQFDYDFGPDSSPVQNGWTQIKPETYGDINWSTTVNAVDRGAISGINNINRDFVYLNQNATLSHKLANGFWGVTLNMGDALNAHDNMQVRAEGIVQHADVDNMAGQFPYANFNIEVTDGELNIEFSDQGGADPNWVLTRMSLNYQGARPVADADTGTVVEDGNTDINVLGNDSDPDAGDTLSVQSVTAGSNGTTSINGDGTIKYTPNANFNGTDQFSYVVRDVAGHTATAQVDVTVDPQIDLETLTVNDGLSPQRSVVDELVIRFDTPVTIAAGAFVVRHRGDDANVNTSYSLDPTGTIATLTFSGSYATGAANRLIDGNYDLTIDGSKITVTGFSRAWDADGNGSAGGTHVFGDTAGDKFFALFGDVDGDRDVNFLDYIGFAQSFQKLPGQPGFNGAFDANGDGKIDFLDYIGFAQNFNKKMLFD